MENVVCSNDLTLSANFDPLKVSSNSNESEQSLTVGDIVNVVTAAKPSSVSNANNVHSLLTNSMSNSSSSSQFSNFSISSVISNDVFCDRTPTMQPSSIIKNSQQASHVNGKFALTNRSVITTIPERSSLETSTVTNPKQIDSHLANNIITAARHTCHAMQPSCLTNLKSSILPSLNTHKPILEMNAPLPVPRCACPAAFTSPLQAFHHRRIAQSQSSTSSGSTSGCQSTASSGLYRVDSNGSSSTKSYVLSPTSSLVGGRLSCSTSTSGISSGPGYIESSIDVSLSKPGNQLSNNQPISSATSVGLPSTVVQAPTPSSLNRIKSFSSTSASSKSSDDTSEVGGGHSECSANSSCALVSPTSVTSAAMPTTAISNQHMTSNAPLSSASFLHYPNIYNPLKTTKNYAKKNKKLIRFMTVCAYVFAVSLVAILLSLYYLFIWNPYTRPTGNLTRTFINSEILFIEKTNYFDVDVSGHPQVIGSAPDSPHLTHNLKVNLTEAKVVVPVPIDSVRRPPTPTNSNLESNSDSSSSEHVLLPVGPAIAMDLKNDTHFELIKRNVTTIAAQNHTDHRIIFDSLSSHRSFQVQKKKKVN